MGFKVGLDVGLEEATQNSEVRLKGCLNKGAEGRGLFLRDSSRGNPSVTWRCNPKSEVTGPKLDASPNAGVQEIPATKEKANSRSDRRQVTDLEVTARN
ncbi:hypothetical protein ACA910_013898 [Epithemia clementina (nom. ined.)]